MNSLTDFPAAECATLFAADPLPWCLDQINHQVLDNNISEPHRFVDKWYRIYVATIYLQEKLGDVQIHLQSGSRGCMRIPKLTRHKFIKQLDPEVQRRYYY